jgi:hypothetical protein
MQQKINTTCINAFYQIRRIVKICKFLSCSACISWSLHSSFLKLTMGTLFLLALKLPDWSLSRRSSMLLLVFVIPCLMICVIFTGYLYFTASNSRLQSSRTAVLTGVLPPTSLASSLLCTSHSQSDRILRSSVVPCVRYDLFLLLHVSKHTSEGRSPTSTPCME